MSDGQQDGNTAGTQPQPTQGDPAPKGDGQPQPGGQGQQQGGNAQPQGGGGSPTDWKAEARKWEDRAKANKTAADELEKIKASGRSELEKAQHDAAEAAKRAQSLVDRTVKAELKSALSGVVSNADDIVQDLDLKRFVDDAGEIKDDAVNALKERYKSFTGNGPRNPSPNPAQGSSGTPPKTLADQIAAAEKAGDIRESLRLKSRQLVEGSQK